MKLGELLEEVKLGTDKYKQLKTAEQIQESFDEEKEDYSISELIGIHIKNLVNEETDENIVKHLKNAYNKVKNIEDRQSKSNYLSESYSRMKYDGLKSAYNDVIALMENKKKLRETNKEVLANALGLIKYKVNEMAKLAGVEEVNLNESNEVFKPYLSKEYKIIRDNIG